MVFDSGDLGAPLLCEDKYLVGIASFTRHHGHFNPYVYTHLVEYRNVIEKRAASSFRIETNHDEACALKDGRTEL